MTATYILAGCLILTSIVVYFLRTSKFKNKRDYQERLNQNKKEILKSIFDSFNLTCQLRKESLEKEVQLFSDKCEIQKQALRQQITELDDYYEKAKAANTDRIDKLQEEFANKMAELSKTEAQSVQSINDYYNSMKIEIEENFKIFSNEIEEKRLLIQNQLKEEEQKQLEIIEQYKRAEEIKQNRDFYRINLSQAAQDDVKKLRTIADELHDPSVLYKLIYKTYYEKPFNEMMGRITTDGAAIGIYKITNLNNGRVYIGQTKQQFKERLRTHVKRGLRAEAGTSNKLYTAMWNEGVENFTFEILSQCKVSELDQKEKDFIAFYHADTYGYNSNKGNG